VNRRDITFIGIGIRIPLINIAQIVVGPHIVVTGRQAANGVVPFAVRKCVSFSPITGAVINSYVNIE